MILTDHFKWGNRCYLMGILNATPDSFSGDGVLSENDPISAAIEQAFSFLENGADIIDIGGESTRPGAKPLVAAEEIDRVIPVIEAIISSMPECIISIDTSKADVAAAALAAGAKMINDVWALEYDQRIASIAAKANVPVVLMHNASRANALEPIKEGGFQYSPSEYGHLLNDVCSDLSKSASLAEAAGILPEQIIVDPGIGFGKSASQNLALLNYVDLIRSIGYPVLVGPSRKSFISNVLGVELESRDEGTAAAIAAAVIRGADIIRVHDVASMKRIVNMCDSIIRTRPDGSVFAGAVN